MGRKSKIGAVKNTISEPSTPTDNVNLNESSESTPEPQQELTQETQSNPWSNDKRIIDVFTKHKPIYDLYAKTGEIVNLHSHIRNEIVNAYKLAHPNYHYNQNCDTCVAEMLHTTFKWYESISGK